MDRSFEATSVQRKAAGSAPAQVHAAAEHGISGSSSPLPHAGEIQRSFGRHDVSGIKAHTGSAAAAGAAAMGAQAFARGNHVVFAGTPDLHTAAHEAAHVVQQRGGLQLKGGVGEVGDPYEQHADAVADAVVAGRSAEPLLDQHAGGSGSAGSNAAIQRAPAKHTPHAAHHEPGPQIASAEGLAKEKYHEAVRDGHDLRYYENVLLYVNQQHHRKGVIGACQDPGVAGNGSNNIQLVAGHRIWLVSPEYAKALESVVPSGSLTGGAVAKVKRFMGHLEDILKSVTESVHHVDEVAGEYAQALRDHLPEIVGITAGFLMAEATSMFLAAAPTGVSQAAAVVIQLALAAFGAAGMVEAGIEALKHGSTWLTTAWTAQGNPEAIAAASKEFLRMLVAIAMAALSYLGAKGNYRNALKIAGNMPTGGLPARATASGSASADAQAGTGVSIGPSTGAFGAAGSFAVGLNDKEKAALGEGPDVDGLSEKNVGEASSSERHDRRAADGRKSPTATEGENSAGELQPRAERRTELAEHIPPRGDAFVEWFDALTLDELDKLLADKNVNGKRGAAQVIGDSIRHPGSEHEWLMGAEARKFKKWGLSMRTIQEGRSLTGATMGKRFRHGSTGAGTMHRELHAMIRSSNSYGEFLEKLNQWADRELVPSHSARWPNAPRLGRYSLPASLQVRGR